MSPYSPRASACARATALPKRSKTDPRGRSANSLTVRRPSNRSSSCTFASTGSTSRGNDARNARPSSTERTSPGGVRSATTRATKGVGAIPADARAPTRAHRAKTFRATRLGAPRSSSVPARSQANAHGSSTPTRGSAAWSVVRSRPCSSGASATTIASVTGSLKLRPWRVRHACQDPRSRRRAMSHRRARDRSRARVLPRTTTPRCDQTDAPTRRARRRT